MGSVPNGAALPFQDAVEGERPGVEIALEASDIVFAQNIPHTDGFNPFHTHLCIADGRKADDIADELSVGFAVFDVHDETF